MKRLAAFSLIVLAAGLALAQRPVKPQSGDVLLSWYRYTR